MIADISGTMTLGVSSIIQNMVDKASSGGTVTIGANPQSGERLWIIDKPISLHSDITVIIDDAVLRLADGVFCNIFYSEGAYEPAGALGTDAPVRNIKIIGKGNAEFDGGTHNGKTERTVGSPEIIGNTFLFFRNVCGFEISGIKMSNSRWWASTCIFCENGVIKNITFDSRNNAPNQDGIDLRIGCNNIEIKDIRGATGDDTVALTALSGRFDSRWLVRGRPTDIHDIKIKDINARCLGGHGVIRLLAQDGNRIYNVNIENVYDLSIDVGGEKCRQGLIRVGENGYTSIKQNEAGDISNVHISHVTSRAVSAIYSGSDNVILGEYIFCDDIVAKEGVEFGGTLAQ